MPSREEKRWEHYHAAKRLRSVRKEIKRNRKPKSVRRKEWMPDSFEEAEELMMEPPDERIMPLGERERKRQVMEAVLEKEDEEEVARVVDGQFAELGAGQSGVVLEVSSSLCRVDVQGETLLCGLRGSLGASDTGYTNVVAAGDRVVVSRSGSDQGVVESVLPRRSVLARPDVGLPHLLQVIVANADQMLIVASWREPRIWLELIDRYLITAERYALAPIICVNKIDLADDPDQCSKALRPYADLGYRVLFTSARSGTGIEKLRAVLRGRTTVLTGLSGVGKSSLASAVEPRLNLRTGGISEYNLEGRHVTTQVRLFALSDGGFLADTPGIREWGLANLSRQALAGFYPEIVTAQVDCRFSDCSHTHEPECAVIAAVENGRVSAARYHSYVKILDSLPG